MQLKENDHGIYLFFPTESGTELQQSVDEMAKLAGMMAFNGTWDIYKVIWPAIVTLQEKLRAAQEESTTEEERPCSTKQPE
jgi:hypothetical protein